MARDGGSDGGRRWGGATAAAAAAAAVVVVAAEAAAVMRVWGSHNLKGLGLKAIAMSTASVRIIVGPGGVYKGS